MLKLRHLIQLSGIALDDFKIHCATGKEDPPLEAFFRGDFKEWQEGQRQKNFECSKIVSLIHLDGDRWLFAGVFTAHGIQKKKMHNGRPIYIYRTKELSGLDHLTGRAIVKFRKGFRASYLRGERYMDQLFVSSIREERMSAGDFPGFNGIKLSMRMLRAIIQQNLPEWRTPLGNVSGVYLIVDTQGGLQYVGSAYGGEGIWQRWCSYVKTGHGGNKELRNQLRTRGKNYADHFQFSLLEVCDLNASKDYVIGREVHWKRVLMSREFGLNIN